MTLIVAMLVIAISNMVVTKLLSLSLQWVLVILSVIVLLVIILLPLIFILRVIVIVVVHDISGSSRKYTVHMLPVEMCWRNSDSNEILATGSIRTVHMLPVK